MTLRIKDRIESGITSTGDIVRMLADEIHNSGGGALVSLAPFTAIIPSAVVLYQATGSIWMAVSIEATGFASAKIGVDKGKQTGNRAWPFVMVGVYVTVAMLLLAGLKVAPVAANPNAAAGELVTAIGQMLLPLLAVLGAIIYAMGTDMADERKAAQAAREQAQAARYDELRWQREQAEKDAAHKRDLDRIRAEANAQAKLAKVSGGVSRTVQNGQPQSSATTGGQPSTDDLLDIWRDDPYASLRTVADIVGRSKSWVGAQKKELEATGVIHVNGNGVEILR